MHYGAYLSKARGERGALRQQKAPGRRKGSMRAQRAAKGISFFLRMGYNKNTKIEDTSVQKGGRLYEHEIGHCHCAKRR